MSGAMAATERPGALAAQGPTVADLLGRALEAELEEDLPSQEAEAWVKELRDALGRVLPPGAERGGVGRVLAMLREALQVPLPRVLVAAWRRYEPFRKYVDPEAYPAGTESEVPLAPHTARCTLTPQVEVVVDGVVIDTLRFDATVALGLEAALVRIRDGRFVALRVGDCTVEGDVRFQGLVVARAEPGRERIPGEISLGAGLPIDPFRDDLYPPPPARA